MGLPLRNPAKAKPAAKANRTDRWRSQAHCTWIRGFACCNCGSTTNVVVAHVRLGSNAGMGTKPDDWRTVPLCDGPFSNADGERGCHDRQHSLGERTFWTDYANAKGQTVERLIDELSSASPRAGEIRMKQQERSRG